MSSAPYGSSKIWLLVAFAFLWRMVIGWLTVVPAEDGVNYLWMAERLAEGQAALALEEIFPPLLPMLIAVPVWFGVDPFFAGKLVLAVAGALCVVPAVQAAGEVVPGFGLRAGIMAAVAHLPIRYAGQVYTEPLFLLVGGFALVSGLRQKWWRLGLFSGIAFWVRPEAVLIPVAFLVTRPKTAWCSVLPFAVLALGLVGWRYVAVEGSNFLPKLSFLWDNSVAGEATFSSMLSRIGQHLLDIPWLWVEAFAIVGLLAILGVLFWRRGATSIAPVVVLLILALLVICSYLPRRRFLVDWMFAILPLAVLGLSVLPKSSHAWILAFITLLGLGLSLRVTASNRIAEREVGIYLKPQLAPGEVVAGDMTRVLYYAGQRPLPPRHFSAEELTGACMGARFVVLQRDRVTTGLVVLRLTEHRPYAMPQFLTELAVERGIVVLGRQ